MELENKTYVSFYLKDGVAHVYAEAIRFLGQPNYIRFLLNGDGTSMIMEPYDISAIKEQIERKRLWFKETYPEFYELEVPRDQPFFTIPEE